MIGMRGTTGGDHARKVTSGNGIGCGATQAFAFILAFDSAFR